MNMIDNVRGFADLPVFAGRLTSHLLPTHLTTVDELGGRAHPSRTTIFWELSDVAPCMTDLHTKVILVGLGYVTLLVCEELN